MSNLLVNQIIGDVPWLDDALEEVGDDDEGGRT